MPLKIHLNPLCWAISNSGSYRRKNECVKGMNTNEIGISFSPSSFAFGFMCQHSQYYLEKVSLKLLLPNIFFLFYNTIPYFSRINIFEFCSKVWCSLSTNFSAKFQRYQSENEDGMW